VCGEPSLRPELHCMVCVCVCLYVCRQSALGVIACVVAGNCLPQPLQPLHPLMRVCGAKRMCAAHCCALALNAMTCGTGVEAAAAPSAGVDRSIDPDKMTVRISKVFSMRF
jgi:hypothetical protein